MTDARSTDPADWPDPVDGQADELKALAGVGRRNHRLERELYHQQIRDHLGATEAPAYEEGHDAP